MTPIVPESSALSRTPRLLTPEEVATLLRVTTRTVRRWAASGDLERVHLGRQTVRYTPEAVAGLIQRTTSNTTALQDERLAGGPGAVTTLPRGQAHGDPEL